MISESRRRPTLAERRFTGGIFGDMFFQFFAPQGLKGPAAAIQRIYFGKVAMLAKQITKYDFAGRYARVLCH